MSHKRLDGERVFDFYLLEDRILLSGEGVDGADASGQVDAELSAALMAEVDGEGQADPEVHAALANSSELETPASELADTESTDPLQPLEVVFVDEGVEDAQTLLEGLQRDAGERQWLVVYLSGQENGIDQITETLA